MLAGPNGAGKSTFYEADLSDLQLPFLNADLLARETGVDAYTAAREIAAIRDDFVRRGQGFIHERVLSEPVDDKVAFMASAAKAGCQFGWRLDAWANSFGIVVLNNDS